jgi:hypothetical protein
MPRYDDDWDDDDQPSRRYYDDDYDYGDYRRLRRADLRSGAVTAVGVISVVYGSLLLLFGLCVLMAGVLMGGAARGFGDMGGPGAGIFTIFAGLFIIVAVLFILFSIGLIVAGVGVLNRSNWGRILALVCAALAAVWGLLYLFGLVGTLADPVNPDKAGGVFVMGLLFCLNVGYCVFVYVVLLNSTNAEEFQ